MHANKYPSNVTLCGNVQMMELNNDDIYHCVTLIQMLITSIN